MPEKCRTANGFCYNPWDKRCKLLGGEFLSIKPYAIGKVKIPVLKRRTKSLWLWNYQSERDLLEKIISYLKDNSYNYQRDGNEYASSVLCGIGITSSDIPILFELFKRYNLLSNSEAFVFQHSFRIVDLSQLAISEFNNKRNFLYPITKDQLLSKYVAGEKFESGKEVWKQYEKKLYRKIEGRVKREIMATHDCYIEILKEIHSKNRIAAKHH